MKRGAPKTKKKPSGAEFKRRRKDAEQLARKMAAAEQASGRTGSALDRYAKLGDVSKDALANVLYANRAAAELLHTVMNDPEIDEASRRKSARELIAVLGMTSIKAIYEGRLRALEAKIYRRRDDYNDGLEECPPDEPSVFDTTRSASTGSKKESE